MRNHNEMNTLVILLGRLGYQEGLDKQIVVFVLYKYVKGTRTWNTSWYRCSKFNFLA